MKPVGFPVLAWPGHPVQGSTASSAHSWGVAEAPLSLKGPRHTVHTLRKAPVSRFGNICNEEQMGMLVISYKRRFMELPEPSDGQRVEKLS